MAKNTILLILMMVVGCTTTGPTVSVLERADGLSGRPQWVKETEPLSEADGKKFFLGYIEVPGTSSKSAALNMSDEKAMSEPMKALVDQFLDQNQVGEDLSSSTGQRIISTTRGFRPPMPGLQIVKRYWEVVQMKGDDNGLSRSSLRVFSLAEISTGEFERAKQAYFARLNGDSEVKKILTEVGQKQRERVLGSESQK